MITPAELARGGTEHGLQRAVFAWANVAMWRGFADAWNDRTYMEREPLKTVIQTGIRAVPELRWYHAIHNQGHGDAIRGGKAKAEGTKAGIPDTFLPVPINGHAGLYIENKLSKYVNHKQGGLSDDQIECIAYLRNKGYAVHVAYSWEETALTLQEYIKYGYTSASRF